MERNNVIGFILLGVLIIAFFFMQSRFANEQRLAEAKKQYTEDSIKHIQDSIKLANMPKDTAAAIVENTDVVVPANLDDVHAQAFKDSVEMEKQKSVYGPFASLVNGEEKTVVLENDLLKINFTNKGGRILRADLKTYTDYQGGPLDIINSKNNSFNYNFYFNNDHQINTEDLYFTPVMAQDGRSVTFVADLGEGRKLKQIYSFNDSTEYMVDYALQFEGFDDIIPKRNPAIAVTWNNEMREQEKNIKYERQYSKFYFGYSNGDVDYKNTNGEIKFNSSVKWLSCQQQFFNTTLIADNNFEGTGKVSVFAEDTSHFVKACHADLVISYKQGDSFTFPMHWYLAPNDYQSLKALDLGMQTIVPTGAGFIGWINRAAIIPMFNWLSSFIGNYGLIILLMTLIIKLVLSPLTYRSYYSMAKMRVLNPELTELREKYADDQARLGQEQLKLYRKAGVNPLGGCIPTLLGMPILIAMFRLFPGSLDLRQQSFLWAKDLSTYDDLIRFNFSIPFLGNHISIFCILMTLSSILYIRMNMQNTSQQLGGSMKMVQYLTPFLFFFFLNSSPAGLTYYYFVSNVTTFGLQWGIRKFFINEEDIHRKIKENRAKAPKAKSGFAKRLEDAMKQQQMMRENQKKGKK
ncbi:MAG: membrane protein insertase YidC [Chitinophagales bacterium]